jgi:hypothetical protein
VSNSPQGKRPDWWPREPAGYVFLAHVVEKIGRASHGDDWTGEEATAEEIEPLPRRRRDASQGNLFDAERLLQHYRPALKRPAVIGSNEFSEKHWKIAYDLAQRLRPALDRLHATQSEIVKRNETDELELRIQPRNGGPWRNFNKDWWNTDKWRSHFDRCCIDPNYPNGRPPWNREDNDHWIFATFRSVEGVLKRPTKEESREKPRKPTTSAKNPKKTPRTRLISLMQEIGLAKSGLLPHEVREKVRPQFQKKHRGLKLPADSTIDRAYEAYTNATDTSAE